MTLDATVTSRYLVVQYGLHDGARHLYEEASEELQNLIEPTVLGQD